MLTFDQPLTENAQNTLQSIFRTRDLIAPLTNKTVLCALSIRQNSNNNTVYKRVASFEYPGTLFIAPISSIVALCYCDVGVTNYYIRAVNVADSTIMCEGVFNNTTETSVSLDSITNLPLTNSTIELQIKKTGGSSKTYVYIDSVTILT
jgi:hypothetical protein